MDGGTIGQIDLEEYIEALPKPGKALQGSREANDFYRTPEEATLSLLAKESFEWTIWEPACGDGAISEVLKRHGHEVFSTDLIDRGYGRGRVDFLLERRLAAPVIVTNPPFKLAEEFALHALHLGAYKICIFARLAWLEGRARYNELWADHPPARIWAFSRRLTLWRGDDPEPRKTGGTMAFAWFVWDQGHVGAPELGWL